MEQDFLENESESQNDQVSENAKRKKEYTFELVLFFILGTLLGITFKSEAVKKITIGFNDYQVESNKPGYDVGRMEKALVQEAIRQQQAAQQQQSDSQN